MKSTQNMYQQFIQVCVTCWNLELKIMVKTQKNLFCEIYNGCVQ